jgi:hypothetical protein
VNGARANISGDGFGVFGTGPIVSDILVRLGRIGR